MGVQHIPIIKTPSFQLSPSSLSMTCGDTTPKTFSVTNSSNLSGVTYQWNIGNGWSGSVGNSSSITLTPIFGANLPSNISVTPFVNGVAQQSKTCTVTLAPFIGNFSIEGSSGLCSSGVYSISGLPTGSSIAWSSSNTNIASLSSPSNSQVTANMVSNGTVTLTATIINPCGQMLVLSKLISVGQPSAVYWVEEVEPYIYQFNAYDYWGCTQNVNTYVWQIVEQTGNVYTTYLGGDVTTIYAVPPFSIHMTLTASNGCASNSQDIYLSLNSEEEELYRIKPKEITTSVIFPNPSNTEITLKLPISKNKNENKVFIYNSLGKIIDEINIENGLLIYNVENLSKGIYFLEFTMEGVKNINKFIVK